MPHTGTAWVEMNLNKVVNSVNATLILTQNFYLLWDIIDLVFKALSSAQQHGLCMRFEEYLSFLFQHQEI
jgi:hypothetical protein